jgi:AcrR family transcriptional regulator
MPSHQFETPPASSRDRLLDAAKRLFAAQGYEQTATSAIAREAGTSESQLMRYFGGKAGLLEALFDDAWAELNARVARALRPLQSNRECILEAIQAIVTALSRDPDLATLFMFEGRRVRGEEPRVRLSRGYLSFAENIRGLVRKAQAAGELGGGYDATAVTSAMLGAAESMIRERLMSKSKAARGFAEREIRRTLDAMLAGLDGSPAARASAARKKR